MYVIFAFLYCTCESVLFFGHAYIAHIFSRASLFSPKCFWEVEAAKQTARLPPWRSSWTLSSTWHICERCLPLIPVMIHSQVGASYWESTSLQLVQLVKALKWFGGFPRPRPRSFSFFCNGLLICKTWWALEVSYWSPSIQVMCRYSAEPLPVSISVSFWKDTINVQKINIAVIYSIFLNLFFNTPLVKIFCKTILSHLLYNFHVGFAYLFTFVFKFISKLSWWWESFIIFHCFSGSHKCRSTCLLNFLIKLHYLRDPHQA